MDFLYPRIDKPTHILNKGSSNTTEYPFKDSYKNSKELVVENDISVAVIRDNIGYSCGWTQVIAFEGNNKDKTFYVLSKDLQNITTKISYKPVCTSENL